MHYSTSEESEGNGGSDGFRTMLAEWKEANPNVNLSENVLANDEYKTQMNTKAWAEQGLVMDLTDVVNNSPYAADYKQDYFTPFKDGDGKIYGLPVLTGGTCTVVVYDKQMWKDAGYDSFPAT